MVIFGFRGSSYSLPIIVGVALASPKHTHMHKRCSLAHRRAMGAVFVSILFCSAPASANWTLSSSSARGRFYRRVEAKIVPIARRCAREPREVKAGKGSAALSRTDEQ